MGLVGGQHSNAPRRHGCNPPVSRLTIGVGTVQGIDIVVYFLCCVPALPDNQRLILAIAFGVVSFSLVGFATYTTLSDPTHPLVYDKGDDIELKAKPGSWSTRVCSTCRIPQEFRTEHCHACDRCVKGFDHHCIWLNNCIGDKNYKSFAWCLVLVIAMDSIILYTCVLLILEYVSSPELIGERLGAPKEFVPIAITVLTVLNLPLLVLDINLTAFHIAILHREMTTVEYIHAKLRMERLEEQDRAEQSDFIPFPRCMDWVVYNRNRPPGFEPKQRRKTSCCVKAANNNNKQASEGLAVAKQADKSPPAAPYVTAQKTKDAHSSVQAASQPPVRSGSKSSTGQADNSDVKVQPEAKVPRSASKDLKSEVPSAAAEAALEDSNSNKTTSLPSAVPC